MAIFAQLVSNSLIAASVYALLAVSFNLAYGTTKFFNLAHGAMATVGAYAVLAFVYWPWLGVHIASLPLRIVLGVIAGGVAGYLLERVVFRPLRQRHASSLVLLVSSLGAFIVIEATIAIMFSNQFWVLSDQLPSTDVYTILGANITNVQIAMMIAAVICTLGLMAVLKWTLFGKAVNAVSDDEEVAKITGINTNRVTGTVFFIASAIAGLAGILVGFDTSIVPTMGMPLLLKGVVAAIVGGVGSVSGAAVGALLLGFAENFGIWKIAGEWKDAIAFILLIVFLLVRPQGIIKR